MRRQMEQRLPLLQAHSNAALAETFFRQHTLHVVHLLRLLKMAAVSNGIASAMSRAISMLEEHKEVAAAAVGLWTYHTMKNDEKRRSSMQVRIIAPPFTFGSDDPVSAGVLGLVAAWSTISIISKNALPLLMVA